MQEVNVNCQRDEYPPIGFWQDQDIHHQYVRMVPGTENGAAGAALFGLGVCHFDSQGRPPASTRNPQSDRVVHGPDRDTEVYTADVTTTLATVSIRFDAYPNQPDFGLTANPCWPSTLIDDPGFALLNTDAWYAEAGNAQRMRTALALYPNPPPAAFTQNNPPRPGYQKRFLDPLLDVDLAFDERNAIHEPKEIKKFSSVHVIPPELVFSSVPKACEAQPTVADATNLALAATSAVVGGGGAQLALNSIPKPTMTREGLYLVD